VTADVRSLFAQAVGHHQAGRLDDAIALYRQAIALKPDLAAAHNNLGSALSEQGKFEEAEAGYRRALALQPGQAEAHNNLGTVLYEREALDDAVACYRAALAIEPGYAEALDNLGAALTRQGKLDEAAESFRQALAHAPGFVRALDNLGAALADQGRPDEAIAAYRWFLQTWPQDADALSGLAAMLAAGGDAAAALETILKSLRTQETAKARRIFTDIVKPLRFTRDDPGVRAMLTRALGEAWARPGELARAGAHLIKQSRETGAAVARAAKAWPRMLSGAELFGPEGVRRLAGDGLLLALLVSAQNADIELERFLTMARRVLLESALRDDTEAGLAFYAALARQCFINEYVFALGEEEIRSAGALRGRLAASLGEGTPAASLTLLAVAAYFPLYSVSGTACLMDRPWPQPVAAVMAQQLREPAEEARLRDAIPSLTPVKDAVSRLVRDQYEENPYPRWVLVPPAEKTGSIAGYLRQNFPLTPIRHKSGGGATEILSAGCGTGQLALEIAQDMNARVLGVDLSRASLGYAARKARELGLTAIEFAQADLLELGAAGRSFDAIECSGVLHHLADPFAGWKVLLSLLRPNGFMLLGFYSEAARRGIAEARRFIAQGVYGVSAGEIRRCRQDLLDRDGGMAASDDFFGISSCRDLLFHVQELPVRLADIAAFLKDNGLTFLGFEADSAILQAYRRRFPDDPAATDLDHWQAFEQNDPSTFAGMYRFWIQKTG
jgi:tetratricopeptide (TPR) repeat protein/SAM-dependent methyltransferase